MDLNELSFCMGLICFSLAVILGSCLVLCTKGRSFWLLGLVFGLGFLRFLLPVEFPHTRVICCWHVYPSIISLLWQELWPGLSLGRGLLILWCVGSVGMLCRLAVTLYRQHRIVQLCQLPQEGSRLHQLCCQAAREAQCSKPVSVGISCRVSTVMMVGFTKPVILLPPQSMQLPASQLHCILLHELYHYRSRDLWLKLGIRIFCCLLWWNPLVYLFKSSVDQILELRCDKHVCSRLSKMEQLQDSSALLEILKIGKTSSRSLAAKYLGIPSKSRLRQRFRLLLQRERRPSKCAVLPWIGAALCMLVFLSSYTVILQPGFPPPAIEGIIERPSDASLTYIFRKEDGQLEYYVEGEFVKELTPEMLSLPPYSDLPIIDVAIEEVRLDSVWGG